MTEEKKKTALGLDENIEGLLCYVLGWVTGLIFLLLEKDNKFVKFHAVQSIALSIVVFVIVAVLFILAFIPYVGAVFSILSSLVSLGLLVVWVILLVKAAQGERFKLPVIGDMADKYSV